jgi:pimeloyl-ACP methyl ester carboxylesterase
MYHVYGFVARGQIRSLQKRREINTMDQRDLEIIGHYVVVEGTRIYYDECGSGIPLICIHTAGASSLEWYEFLPIMAKNGFRTIAIDLPGHGKSYPVNWEPFREMREYAAFTWKVVRAICAGEKSVVAGSSIGGNMVLDFGCHYSEHLKAVLMFEGGAYHPLAQQGSLWRNLEDPHACPGWRGRMERGPLSSCYYPMAEGKTTVEVRWQHRYSPQEIQIGDLQCYGNHDLRNKLKDVKCPVLAFKGEADYFVFEEVLDEVVAGIPDGLAEKCIGPKMGHYPMFEKPQALADICMDFLRRRNVI